MSRKSKEVFPKSREKLEKVKKNCLQALAKLCALAGVMGALYFGYYLHLNEFQLGRPARENTQTVLYEGVVHSTEALESPRPLMVHTVQIDSSQVDFFVTPGDPQSDRDITARTTSAFLKEFGLQLAVNANFFSPFDASFPVVAVYPQIGESIFIHGQAISSGVEYAQPKVGYPVLCISPDSVMINSFSCPIPTEYAVAGNQMLVSGGSPVANLDNKTLHPRVAIGITQEGRVLVMVVDGRQKGYSEGVTLKELADLLVRYGVKDAVNLDGGGSATLVHGAGERLNSVRQTGLPIERPVGNHLGIWAQPLQK